MLFEKWLEVVARSGDRVALWDIGSGEKVTFRELNKEAEQYVQTGGVWRADGNSREFLATLLAAWKRGTPVVLMENHRHEVRSIEGGVPEGTCLIKQACGASGLERSLFFGEAEVWAEARRNIDGLGLVTGRPGLSAISLAHSYGFGCLVLPLLLGGIPLHIVPAPLPMFLETALGQEEKVFLPGVPAIWKTWWKTGITGHPAIDLALSAGAPLSSELEAGIFKECGLKIHNFYGTSETGAVAFDQSARPREEAGVLGNPLPGVKVRVSGNGRLLVESDSRATGADRLLGGSEFQKSVYETTDLVGLRDELIIWIGSAGDAINVAGRKVSPEKVERALRAIPGVKKAKVGKVQSPDFERFEEISASIRPVFEKKILREALRQDLENWEIPRVWDFGDQ
jgi:acyl-CoA synthetase (AMP-forming)/AMP-acid ligase II